MKNIGQIETEGNLQREENILQQEAFMPKNAKQIQEQNKNIVKITNQFRSRQKQCKCHLCGKKFSQHFYLKSHLKRVHSVNPYICKNCQMSFEKVKDLKLHIRTEHLKINEQDMKQLNKRNHSPASNLQFSTKKLQKEAEDFLKIPANQQQSNNDEDNSENENYQLELRCNNNINYSHYLKDNDSSSKSSKNNNKSSSSDFILEEEELQMKQDLKQKKITKKQQQQQKKQQQQIQQQQNEISPQITTQIDLKQISIIVNHIKQYIVDDDNRNSSINNIQSKFQLFKNEQTTTQSTNSSSQNNKNTLRNQGSDNSSSDLKFKFSSSSEKEDSNNSSSEPQRVMFLENLLVKEYNYCLKQFVLDIKKKSEMKLNTYQKNKQTIDFQHYQQCFSQLKDPIQVKTVKKHPGQNNK